MTTYRGTQEVEPGLYYNAKKFALKSIDERDPLPGPEDVEYRRVPMLLVLACAPLIGLAYVIFLPFIGFAMVLWLLGRAAAAAAADVVRVLRQGRQPLLVFTRRQKPTGQDREADHDATRR